LVSRVQLPSAVIQRDCQRDSEVQLLVFLNVYVGVFDGLYRVTKITHKVVAKWPTHGLFFKRIIYQYQNKSTIFWLFGQIMVDFARTPTARTHFFQILIGMRI
jgi:hypothetical protein